MNPCGEHTLDVVLYLDNELDGQELEDFLAHLADCAFCRIQLEEERELLDLLHRSRPLYTTPDQLRSRVSAATQHVSVADHAPGLRKRVLSLFKAALRAPEAPLLPWSVMAAIALVCVSGLVFIPKIAQRMRAATFLDTALTTHRSYLEGKLPLEIESDSPETVTAWFAGKVPFDFRLPTSQLSPNGLPAYRQVGARLVNYRGRYAALVMYAKRNEEISMLVASSKSAAASGGEESSSGGLTFHYHTKGEFNVITWNAHGLTYALVSSLHSSARQPCLVCHQNMADKHEFREHQ
jgi:anti-sigma factor RsiW